jgi:hypothetical protein
VADAQVAALRAILSDDLDLHRRLFADLDRAEAKKGYTALVTAAFAEAVQRRFGAEYRAADVAMFIAAVRACSARVAEALDPDAAERVIRLVYEDLSVKDLDRTVITRAKFLLLAGLIADARLDGAGLDEFLAAARKLGDQLMGG